MKRVLVLGAVFLLLFAALAPNPAWARGGGHYGHHGGHGGHGWWLPGIIIGGLVLGAVAVVTAPFRAYSAPPPASPPVVYAPPAAYNSPPVYSAPPAYAPPTYQRMPAYAPPQTPAVQREVVYAHGRHVLYGDGVRQPWQWVWVPAAAAPSPLPAP